MVDQQRARKLFGAALVVMHASAWAALLLIFRVHPPEPGHPGLVVAGGVLWFLVSFYLRHSATPCSRAPQSPILL